ncbi:hypothetical protein FQA39_LY06666 [Lamprigera yunnana]|nr:hypothetical protein FQA39_LY06666 [Lamprigera yunnana]
MIVQSLDFEYRALIIITTLGKSNALSLEDFPSLFKVTQILSTWYLLAINKRKRENELYATSTSKKGIIKKAVTELVDIVKSYGRITCQIIRPTEPPAVQSDDIDLFFLSLAKAVKKLPQNEQIHLKMGISKLVFETERRNLSLVTQSQLMTVTIPDPSPVQSSFANSYSNESETVIQSPFAPHYFPHINENLRSTRHCMENTNGSANFNPLDNFIHL